MKKRSLFLLSLLSGLIFALSWPARGWTWLIFFAFIPLFLIEDEICRNKQRYSTWSVLFLSYPAFLTWNILTTWWIYYATPVGAILANLLNSLFMALAFTLFHWSKKYLFGYRRGHALLIFFWFAYEYLHLNWDLTWSWLNLGNVFADHPHWIQWYEYTGTFGGDLWIFITNILIYRFFIRYEEKRFSWASSLWKNLLLVLAIVIIPLIISNIIYYNYHESGKKLDVTIVQPNIDPYKEQYSLPPHVVMDRIFLLAKEKLDSSSDLLVCPESAIQEDLQEDSISRSPSFQQIQSFLKGYPDVSVIFGASTFKLYSRGEDIPYSARYAKSLNRWYDAYNTAVFSDVSGAYKTYHKSKLVVGVEKMPFPQYLHFLEKYAINLGGTVGTLAISPERSVFHIRKDSLDIASAICYESVYGEFFSGFVKNGARLMCIITNDGWWNETAGHRQHKSFASLRAVETRRSIVRSANTGISCFVNPLGEVFQATKYWEPAVIRQKVSLNDQLTLYVRYGDYLARWALYNAIFLVLLTLFVKFKKQ